jgi:uncharacterized protein Yka (UPF0111/DUF47 family)
MAHKKGSADDFADFLYCLGSLERKNSQLFEELANKTDLSDVKMPLLKISRGNEDHAKVLIELSGRLGRSDTKSKECERKMMPMCKLTESFLETVQKKEKITAEELSEVLLTLENSGDAIQYLHIQAETFLFMSKEISQLYGMDLKDFHDHVLEIAQQVEEHIELLEEIKAKIEQSTSKKPDVVHHPLFKYQTPDAW